MRMIHGLIYVLVTALLLSSQALAHEDLDELEARRSRKRVNTFYSGEDAASHVWQPQTVIYKDTSTHHEVWVWGSLDDSSTNGGQGAYPEYGWQPWSADGKRMTFSQDKNVGCFTRDSRFDPWFTARSDGTYWRPQCETMARTVNSRGYPNWSPTYPDVQYVVPFNSSGVSGADENAVNREVVTDTGMTSTQIADMIPGNTGSNRCGRIKSNLTGDGLYFIGSTYTSEDPYYIVQVEPAGSCGLVLSWNFPAIDTYWLSSAQDDDLHDEFLTGNASEGYWFYVMPGGGSNSTWWRLKLWAEGDTSSAPTHTQDRTSPYDWWEGTASQQEVQVVMDEYGTSRGPEPDHVTLSNYSAHSAFDQWGTHYTGCDTNIGPAWAAMQVVDISDNDNSWDRIGLWNESDTGCYYTVWEGWTDYPVFVSDPPAQKAILYDSTSSGDHILVAQTHSNTVGDFQSPGQSPDGTKMVSKSDWLNPSSGISDLFIGVVYYPYPPEIKSVTASGGTVSVEVWWDLDGDRRGYTERGWPDEDSDPAPLPREIREFRLWRCTGTCTASSGTWTPLTQVDYGIFNTYDFSDGIWRSGNEASNTWTLTSSAASSTQYFYAVTSVEWSGLESRTLRTRK